MHFLPTHSHTSSIAFITIQSQSSFTFSPLLSILFYFYLVPHYPFLLYPQGADPYCVVHIGGDKGRSTICRDTLNPQWDTTVVLYTRNPWGKKVHIDVSCIIHMEQ